MGSTRACHRSRAVGKTANYTGLIAKAADAGYKFIIVIAGIHNNLRRQTQERIDDAFIGDPATRG